MPKLRTKSAFKKRFKVTKRGKVAHLTTGDAKYHGRKTSERLRRAGVLKTVTDKTLSDKVKQALGR